MPEQEAVGYVIIGSNGTYFCRGDIWRNVPFEQACVYSKGELLRINGDFLIIGGDAPQFVMEAYRKDGKTQQFSGYQPPFADVVKELITPEREPLGEYIGFAI